VELLAIFLGVTFLAALTPGLAVMLVTSHSLERGLRRAWQATLGIEIGNAIFVLASATGLTALLVACAPLFTVVRWCGAVYLIFLGAMLLISAFRAPAVATEMPQTKGLHPVAQGVTTQLGNPKALLYWTALFPQFIDRTHPLFAQFLLLGILAICVETVVLIGYSFAAASVRRAVSSQPFMQRVLKGVTGCFFILIGLLLGRRTANV
jgi:homoserine/homoserine lactone efflux protein